MRRYKKRWIIERSVVRVTPSADSSCAMTASLPPTQRYRDSYAMSGALNLGQCCTRHIKKWLRIAIATMLGKRRELLQASDQLIDIRIVLFIA